MTGKWDYNQITRIQQANDIVDVIAEHLSLEKRGKELVGLCPFHTDHRPSMYVNPTKQIFKCFACGSGGDVLKFVQMKENLSFPQAIERLAKRAGIDIQPAGDRKSKGQNELDANFLAKLNTWAMNLWIANLNDKEAGVAAREYLKRRNISEESIRQWRLGFAVDAWDDLTKKAMANRGTAEVLTKAGLAVDKQQGGCYDKFRNRLMFPIQDVTGRIIGFGGRTLGDDPAKYMNSPATVLFDKSQSLYGLYQAREAITQTGTVVIVEGYTDVMMAHQFGITNVVATLGTSLTGGHAHTLRRYAKRIVLIFDSDVAGKAAADRAVDLCLTEQVDIKVAFVPQEKDPCEFLLETGTQAFQDVIDSAQDVLEFKWKMFEERLGQSQNLADRTAAVKQFLQIVTVAFESGRMDSITQKVIMSRLAELLGIQPSQVAEEIAKIRQFKKRKENAVPAETHQKPVEGSELVRQAQQHILESLLLRPELFKNIKDAVDIRGFHADVRIHEISEVLADMFEQETQPALSLLYGCIESPETSKRLTELYESAERKKNLEQQLRESIKTLEHQQILQQMETLKQGLGEKDGFVQIMELMKKNDRSRRCQRQS